MKGPGKPSPRSLCAHRRGEGELPEVDFAGGRGDVSFHWMSTLLSLSVAGRGQGDDEELCGQESDFG